MSTIAHRWCAAVYHERRTPLKNPSPLVIIQNHLDDAYDDLSCGCANHVRYQRGLGLLRHVQSLLAVQTEREAAADALRRNGWSSHTTRLIAQSRRAEEDIVISEFVLAPDRSFDVIP